MLEIKTKKKNYKVEFSFEAVARTGIIGKVQKLQDELSPETAFTLAPELLLVGLQKHHKNPFGFKYGVQADFERALSIVYGIMDEIFEMRDNGVVGLLLDLNEELMNSGFLSGMSKETEQQEESQGPALVEN